jgi:hypothetical protein
VSFTRPLDAFIVCDRRHLKTFSACETSRSHPPPCLHSEGGNFKKGSRRKTQTGPTGTDYSNLRPFEDHLRCSQPSRWPQNTWAVKTVGELYVFSLLILLPRDLWPLHSLLFHTADCKSERGSAPFAEGERAGGRRQRADRRTNRAWAGGEGRPRGGPARDWKAADGQK